MFIFISAFFIFAPILIFYSSGYRYDIKRHKVLKTGTLYLEAKDLKKANLYLNDEFNEEPFSEKKFIYNLLPGEYTIKLEKEGYHNWQKKITIDSGLTTFVKDIVLFEKNIPLQIVDGQVNNFSLSPDQQKIVYLIIAGSQQELYLYDLNTSEKKQLYRIPSLEKINLTWSASSKKILLNSSKENLVLDIQNIGQIQILKNIIKFLPANVIWDISSDNLLYAINDNNIYKIDLLAKNVQKIFTADNIKINNSFFIEANDLFYIQESENRNILSKYNFNYRTNKEILDLNISKNYIFITSANNFIGLVDTDQQKLYLIKKVNTEFEINISSKEDIKEFDAKNAVWDIKEKQILIYNDFEVYLYNTDSSEKTFINRYGQIIKKAQWYPDLAHLVILFEDSLQIIDVNIEETTRHVTELVKFDQLGEFYLNNNGQNLFFNGQIGKQQGLYQLKLR